MSATLIRKPNAYRKILVLELRAVADRLERGDASIKSFLIDTDLDAQCRGMDGVAPPRLPRDEVISVRFRETKKARRERLAER